MELESFLAQEGYAGPYILVGHGMGTVYSRIFAVRNRENVKGIVWLDPLNPTALARMEEAGLAMKLPDRRIRPLIRLFIALWFHGKAHRAIWNFRRAVRNGSEFLRQEQPDMVRRDVLCRS